MELKDFVKETLTQIANGVKEAQNEYAEIGGAVNPDGLTSLSGIPFGTYGQRPGKDAIPMSDIHFEVSLSDEKGENSRGGIGVLFGALTIGGEAGNTNTATTATKIKFNIPVQLPLQKAK